MAWMHTQWIGRWQRLGGLQSGPNRATGYLDNNRSCWDVLWGRINFIKLLQLVKMNDAVD